MKKTTSGLPDSGFGDEETIKKVIRLTQRFEEQEGRRPRLMMAKMGQGRHDRGIKVVAATFADFGFDVDIGPLFHSAQETARQAAENDVHIVGMSSYAKRHNSLLPQVVNELKKLKRDDILVTIGGVIPKEDYEYLYNHGAAAIFGPGTKLSQAALILMEKLS